MATFVNQSRQCPAGGRLCRVPKQGAVLECAVIFWNLHPRHCHCSDIRLGTRPNDDWDLCRTFCASADLRTEVPEDTQLEQLFEDRACLNVHLENCLKIDLRSKLLHVRPDGRQDKPPCDKPPNYILCDPGFSKLSAAQSHTQSETRLACTVL